MQKNEKLNAINVIIILYCFLWEKQTEINLRETKAIQKVWICSTFSASLEDTGHAQFLKILSTASTYRVRVASSLYLLVCTGILVNSDWSNIDSIDFLKSTAVCFYCQKQIQKLIASSGVFRNKFGRQ